MKTIWKLFVGDIRRITSNVVSIIIVIGLVLFPLYAALSWGISKVLKVPAGRRGIWSFGATFCNNGFMGFPVALALFGEEGLALAVMFGVPFNLIH